MANPISHRAVLVALNQRAWKGTATDREVAAQAELHSAAEQGTMTVIKALTPKHVIQPIRTILTMGRQEHYKLTMPGLIQGQQLLPTAIMETYMLTQGAIKEQFEEQVEKFVDYYPEARDRAKQSLGNAFKESDFPTTSGIRSYFDYAYHMSPVPEVTDWRLDGVDPRELSEMRRDVENSVQDMYRKAHETILDRTKTMLENLMSQAKNWSASAPGAMLRDATIANAKELISIVREMNITGDPLLEKIGEELQQFAELEGAELRKSAEQRKEVAAKAQKILAKMVAAKTKTVKKAA